MLIKCDPQEFQLFVGIARRIWLRRNSLIHEGIFAHPNEIIHSANTALSDFHQGQELFTTGESQVIPSLSCTWTAPPLGWVKANWDAAIMEKTGLVGLGVVIRDHQGNMVAAKSLTRTGLLEPVIAEAVAALIEIQISHELGYSTVWFEGDAKIIVDAILSNETDWSRKRHLVDDIRVDLKHFTHWKLSYMRRGANQAAHLLAKLATRQEIEKLWTSVPPDCIVETIVAEQSALLL